MKYAVVARRLDPPLGNLGEGHAYVVSNAQFVGDPQAEIYSFGKLANGNMGNVGGTNVSQLSATTAASDVAHWKSLDRNETENVAKIDAPDAVVDTFATSMREDRPYSLAPNPGEINYRDRGKPTPEVNSNSAAFAIGDKAEQASGPWNAKVDRTPFTLTLRGALASDKVKFGNNKVFCTGSRIARESC